MDDEPPYQITFTHLREGAIESQATLLRTVEATLCNQDVGHARIHVAIVDDDEIARLNKKHLNHDGPTDVLSFDLSDDGDTTLEGELVVSIDTAKRQAGLRQHSVEAELALYVAHGVLHLIGHNDASEEQASRMHEIEDTILMSIGVQAVFRSGDRQGTQ